MKRIALAIGLTVAGVMLVLPAWAVEFAKESVNVIEKNLATRRAVLVDVREDRETKRGYIDGAILVPLSLLEEGKDSEEFGQVLAQRLPPKSIIYTYCESSRRCVGAAQILKRFGYDVRPLKIGFSGLVKEGFVTAKPKK